MCKIGSQDTRYKIQDTRYKIFISKILQSRMGIIKLVLHTMHIIYILYYLHSNKMYKSYKVRQ